MLKNLNPDVIIGSEYNLSAVQTFLWAKGRGIPYINLTDGTLRSETYIGRIQKLTRKLIISRSDGFLASSTKAKEKLLHRSSSASCRARILFTLCFCFCFLIERK